MKKYIIVVIMACFSILDSFCQINEIEYFPEQRGLFRILEINKRDSLVTIFAERIDSDDIVIEKLKSEVLENVVMIVSIVRKNVTGKKIKKNRMYDLTLNSLYVKSVNGIMEDSNRYDYYINYHGFSVNPLSKYHTYDVFESKEIQGKYYVESSPSL